MHPDDYRQRWRSRFKLTEADWSVSAHQACLRSLALAGCSDQLDLVNLAICESLFREIQAGEHHYRQAERDQEGKARKDKKHAGVPADEMDLFLDVGKSSYDCMVCPMIQEHIAKTFERDANIVKQTRKAREERALARK